jgi:putative DNA primase/helicase
MLMSTPSKQLSRAEYVKATASETPDDVFGKYMPGGALSKATAPASDVLTEISDEGWEQLRSALRHLCPHVEDNGTWAEVGYGLLSIQKTRPAERLWFDFSKKAIGYEPGAPEQWWEAHKSYTPRCDYRHVFTLALKKGWNSTSAPEVFAPVTVQSAPPPPSILPLGEIVPFTEHLCTDQKNAARLEAHFVGSHLIASAGSFYVFKGTHWERDNSEATRYGAKLPEIVGAEAAAARAKFNSMAAENPDGRKLEETVRRDMSKLEDNLRAIHPEMVKALYQAETLEKWEKSCAMRTNQNNALLMLRDMVNVDADKFDRDPMLFNCRNGTVDLRTGELRPHDANDFITRCAPIDYNPKAKAPRFEQFLVEITDKERAAFLQRWFGYCATGDTREQKLLVHIGDGGNGKGTLIETVENVLGEYASTAPRGFLTAPHGDDRHSTEIANLHGCRMVTCHESEDGAPLREGFVKQVTGQDRLNGRYLYKEAFNFLPTHKLQLLTNHKPQIRGSDFGIWRRIAMVNYDVKFGSAEDVASGKATRVRDTALKASLLAEREGIFAWLVRGAIEWYANGLQPPASVLEAGEAYRLEQDRVGQFVTECCTLDPDAWAPFGGAFGGLYPAYTLWCRSSGYQALGKKRFIDELPRLIPKFRKAELKRTNNGARRSFDGAYGVKVNPEFGGPEAFTPVSNNTAAPVLASVDNSDLVS